MNPMHDNPFPGRGGPHGRRHHPRGGRGFAPGEGPGGPFGHFGPGGHGGPGPEAFGGPGGPAPRRHRGPHGGRGRAGRGDVRAAVLTLLAQEPMHGYQLMQAIAERSGGRWTPSPGAIYPTINQLEDEGLVTVTAESGRKLVTLTDAGREHAAGAGTDPFAGFAGESAGPDLRGTLEQLHGAVRQIARTGTEVQLTTAVGILAEARRALYLLLAEGPDAGSGSAEGSGA